MKTAKQNKMGFGFSGCDGALLQHISDQGSAALKNIVCGLLILGLIFWLSGGVSACCDVGNGTCYTCGDTIYASCTLNADLTSAGDCFTVGADGITIDGNGHSITGNTTGDGIETEGDKDGVTIKNFKIYNFSTGIYLGGCGSDDNQITNNDVSLNLDGIIITDVECGSDNNTVIYNKITNNTNNGVYFNQGAYNNNLTENLICSNGLDVNDSYAANLGDENTCNTTYNWNDTSATGEGCLYRCVCECPADGWVNISAPYDCCDGAQACTCQERENRDYYCDSYLVCQYNVIGNDTVRSGCVGCDDGVDCTDDACVDGVCAYTADDGNCPSDGWVNIGAPYGCCSGIQKCTCQERENRDHYCDPELGCRYDAVGTDTLRSGCVGCDDGIECTDDACVDGTCKYTSHCERKRRPDCPECEDIGMVIRPEPILEEPPVEEEEEPEEDEPEEEEPEEEEPEEEPEKEELKELAIIVPEDITEGEPFTVTVRDKDGNPVGNANVDYNGVVRQTDANGKVQFTAAKGTKTIKTSKQGYKDGSATATSSEVEEEVVEEEEKVVEKKKEEEGGFNWIYVIGIIILVLILLFILMRRRREG
ncbi:MAG: hypothetical protein A7316_03015 [Candidatus Altiarchaeales archaeon WOR_SM1_86-2]|nr:MAG: hypothetical protein A7316_03015 [Candidatus Altiarchaeales archaeon WOR_SM1_86-2]